MKDTKGKLIGLPYDYEYRGWKRERYRDLPLRKLDVIWSIIGLLFALGGLTVLIKSPSEIALALICFAITTLIVLLILKQHKQHNTLLKIIDRYK